MTEKKEFAIDIDVIMSGTIYIEAKNRIEALKKIESMQFVASDLKYFYELDKKIINIV